MKLNLPKSYIDSYLRKIKQVRLSPTCELHMAGRIIHCCFAHTDFGQFHFPSDTRQVVLIDARKTDTYSPGLPFNPFCSFPFASVLPTLAFQ